MDISSIVSFATKALDAIPGLVSAGANIVNLVSSTKTALSNMQSQNRGPTKAEWDALDAEVASLRRQLHAGEQPAGGTPTGT